MRVEIDTGNSTDPAMLAALERHKPLIARWARRWRANLRAIAGQQQNIYLEPPQDIVIFRPFSSTPIATRGQKELRTIFGYSLPELTSARTRLAPSDSAQPFLSPESNRVAQAQPGVFSFLVDVLGHDWEGAEEVANIMFACTLPKALPETHVRKRARRLKDILKRKLRRDRERIEAAYLRLAKEQVQTSIERNRREIDATTARMAEKERERLAALREMAEIEDYLEHAETHIKTKEEIGREFEQILRMEGVAVLRIDREYIGEGPTPVITIHTECIFQVCDGARYDVGSFRIKIDPSQLTRAAVKFVQDARGEYTHPHALPEHGTALCFGNEGQNDGLNPAVDKLVANFDIVPLAHLLLTFLRLDQAHPKKAAFPKSEDIKTYLAYASPEDRAKERAAFIEVIGETLMRIHTQKSRKRLKELEEKERAAAKEYYAARRERNELKERVKLLEQRLTTLPESARNALRRLLANSGMLYARVFERSLQVWFWNAKTSSIHLAWLDSGRSPWIVGYEKLDGISKHHMLDTSDEKFKRRVLKLLASSKFSQTAELLIGHILSSVR